MNTQELLTRKEAAAYLGVSHPSLARWASTGFGPAYFRLGRDARYERAELDAFLSTRRRDPARQADGSR